VGVLLGVDGDTVAHPLIHLGYAYELNSRTVAIEALALGACFYSPLHKYLDDPFYTRPGEFKSTSLLDILDRVRNDKRFDGLYDHRSGDISKVFEEREEAFLEYWNAWELADPKTQFAESQQTAVAILMATPQPAHAKFDFFFVHLLTSSHAVRILLPLIPAKFHISLVRQWWLFALAVYIAQTRPEVKMDTVMEYGLAGRSWKFVLDKALNSQFSMDAHFVKGKLSVCSMSPILVRAANKPLQRCDRCTSRPKPGATLPSSTSKPLSSLRASSSTGEASGRLRRMMSGITILSTTDVFPSFASSTS
jgi:hypothetical protein